MMKIIFSQADRERIHERMIYMGLRTGAAELQKMCEAIKASLSQEQMIIDEVKSFAESGEFKFADEAK